MSELIVSTLLIVDDKHFQSLFPTSVGGTSRQKYELASSGRTESSITETHIALPHCLCVLVCEQELVRL